ncbi:MAG: hypothetical protein AAGK70_16460 [Pseudomonadota bacterium]
MSWTLVTSINLSITISEKTRDFAPAAHWRSKNNLAPRVLPESLTIIQLNGRFGLAISEQGCLISATHWVGPKTQSAL